MEKAFYQKKAKIKDNLFKLYNNGLGFLSNNNLEESSLPDRQLNVLDSNFSMLWDSIGPPEHSLKVNFLVDSGADRTYISSSVTYWLPNNY